MNVVSFCRGDLPWPLPLLPLPFVCWVSLRRWLACYQMLAGASQQEREYYQLYRPSDYAFLNQVRLSTG